MESERLNLPSASGAEIWMNCPAQPNFVKTLPPLPEEQEETTLSGQRIHEALRTESTTGLSGEEVATYELAIKNQNSLLEQWKLEKGITLIKEGVREERCYLRGSNGEVITSGQLDRHWIAAPYLLIEDLKSQYCWHLSPSHLNKQLRTYAVLAWMEYDGIGGQPINEVRVALNKPKVRSSSIDCTDYSRNDLEMSKRQILFELWETQQPDAQFRPGPWCDWCAGKAYCKSAGAYSLLPASIADNAVEMVNQLSHEDLRRIFEYSGTVVKILDATKKRLKALSEPELAELGLMFGKAKTLRPITNPASAWGFLAMAGIPAEQLWRAVKIGNSELAAVVQESLKLSSKKAAEDWIRTKLANFITEQKAERPLEKI
jgi:hypothetical protein